MARKIINIGTYANDGSGDDLRTGAGKINDNFLELYSSVDAMSLATSGVAKANGIGYGFNGIMFDGSTQDSFGTSTRLVPTDPTKINYQTLQDSSGVLAFLADITRIISPTHILNITGSGFQLQDEQQILNLIQQNSIDSARAIAISIDSSELLASVDSAYVQSRQAFRTSGEFQPYIDSAVRVLEIQHNNEKAEIDSDIAFLYGTLGAFDTDDVTEGANLYYTKARTDSDIVSQLSSYSGDILPDLDSTRSLGSPTHKWKDLHLSGSTIYLGGGTLSFDGSSYSFGGGYPLSPDTIALDSAQRMFFGQYANIVNYAGNHGQGLYLNGNKIEHRTVDDASTGYFHRTNQQIVRLGDTGVVTLPHNTSNTRTSYSTNAGYTDWKIGSMHYNTDLGQFEMHDSTGWFAIDRDMLNASGVTSLVDSAYVQARQSSGSGGSAAYLHFGIDAQVSNASSFTFFTIDHASAPQGYVMPTAGTISNLTLSATCNGHTGGSLTCWISVLINGTEPGQIAQVEVTGTGNVYINGAVNLSYSAGDRISLELYHDAGLTTVNHAALIRAVES
jgi:hypothetical protein